MTSRLLGRALRGALTRCRPSTPQLLSSRLGVPRTARFSQAVDTPPAAEAETSSVAAAVAAEPAEEAATELPVAAAAQDVGAAEEPAAAAPLTAAAMAKRIKGALKDRRHADVLAMFDDLLGTYTEGAMPGVDVVDAALESKALTAGVPAALQMLSLVTSRFPSFEAEVTRTLTLTVTRTRTLTLTRTPSPAPGVHLRGGDAGVHRAGRQHHRALAVRVAPRHGQGGLTLPNLTPNLTLTLTLTPTLTSGQVANHDVFNTLIMVYCAAKVPSPPYTSLHLPIPPYTSLHLPAPPYASLHLPLPPCTSLHLPAPP